MTHKPHRFSDAERAEMVALYQSGWGLTQVARRYDCAPPTVRYWLLQHGVTMRAERRADLLVKICATCGGEFRGIRRKRFCCEACWRVYDRKLRRERHRRHVFARRLAAWSLR